MSEVMSLPLDATGKAPSNHITDEHYVIGSAGIRAIATDYGGFYASSLIIRDVATGEPLGPDQYFLSGIMDLATAKYGAANATQIVSIVVVTDPAVSSNVELDYQALGVQYATPQTAIANAIETYEPDTRSPQWPSVIDDVADLPASQALHDAGQEGLITFEYVVHAIDRLQQLALMGDPIAQDEVKAYADGADNTQTQAISSLLDLLVKHEADHANPHRLTPGQILALTQSQQDAAIRVETSARIAADTEVDETLNDHITDYANPHQTTLAQVDMYSVAQANNQISIAQNGVNAVLASNVSTMNAHINNTNNPHQTTPAELGTLSASDISAAIAAAASTVTSGVSAALSTLNAHIGNTANPHELTPAQLGTWTAAQLQSLASAVSGHAANYSNPHGDTVDMIGGMASDAIDSAINSALSGLLSYYSNNNAAMVGHVNNFGNPHQVSAQAIGCVGPWNNLAGDLNNAQAQINASGHPVTESPTQYFSINYSGAMGGNFERSLEIAWSISAGTAYYRPSGGDNTFCGIFPFFSVTGGAQVQGFFRSGNVISIYVLNGSLDGMTFTSSIGDNVLLSNARSYTFLQTGNGLFTLYCGISAVGQTGTPRSYAVNFTGSPLAPQPPMGYVNNQPPAPPPPPQEAGGGA
ncbi:hypothetical protein HDG34_003209 [Paraburkholderia sp. HC6.4b]|uniref:hypothetical protein n=1 Tax=unclassified Paraburkholderia TaxID=2615204 RepID=UPI0016070E4B|nr:MULTISPECIES: hypothetical protein [unclassified Paraburkholderia]MBB5409268.1 hypothetical protein [Paraburkholderia sp. HC6.4b]MBB5450996.1 hypothetical protein [Paraburkholderia sp. Kb1A]